MRQHYRRYLQIIFDELTFGNAAYREKNLLQVSQLYDVTFDGSLDFLRHELNITIAGAQRHLES